MLCLMFAASAVLLVGCNGEGDESAASEGSSTQSDKDFSNEVKNWGGENMAGTLGFYTNLIMNYSTDITSQWESSVNSFQTGIDNFVEQCY